MYLRVWRRKIVASKDLKGGINKSCGCLAHPCIVPSKSPLYGVYSSILARCYNPNCKEYPSYGGRGITMCDEWREDNNSFFRWALDNGYKQGLEIDRERNNGNYEPSNCRFVNRSRNMRNTRRTVMVEYQGITKPLIDWCDELNLRHKTIHPRIRDFGWTVERAFTTPVRQCNNPITT